MPQSFGNIYIDLLRTEVLPALGCTEPIAVSLAVARAREALAQPVARVVVQTSANIYKNGMGVGIPGTGQTGLPIAAALGALIGDSADSLELLKGVTPEDVARAAALIEQNCIEVSVAKGVEKLYVKATVFAQEGKSAYCIIRSKHSRIAEVGVGRKIIFSDSSEKEKESLNGGTKAPKVLDARVITLRGIYDFITTAPFEDLEFILETERMNRIIAEEGLAGEYGLQVGRRLWQQMDKGLLSDNLLVKSMALTAAASDARMAGSTTPVMSNSGSGNQGITATLPVVAVADQINATREQLARALALSHLVAIHIKGYLGRLSALCGCVVASSGAGCGVAYLLGGDYNAICATVKNMIGNVTGMVCDGAKVGCALKVSSGVSSAIQSALLGIEGICISANDGIIDNDVEKTIQNLGRVGSEGMAVTDELLLNIMTEKANC